MRGNEMSEPNHLKMPSLCHCGRPLHYSDPHLQVRIEALIRELGEFAKITVMETGRAWLVPRHYIALHGIKARDLPTLGFREVKP
jgi:hypothetical protein